MQGQQLPASLEALEILGTSLGKGKGKPKVDPKMLLQQGRKSLATALAQLSPETKQRLEGILQTLDNDVIGALEGETE